MNPQYMKAIRLVILEPIEDPEQRKKAQSGLLPKRGIPASAHVLLVI
jgi:hypothetical protein